MADDFNMSAPPESVTNPTAAGQSAEYPRHVHQYAPAPTQAEITAGAGTAHYTSGAYLVVHDDKEKAAALKDGWSETPVLTDPDAPVDLKTDKKSAAKGK